MPTTTAAREMRSFIVMWTNVAWAGLSARGRCQPRRSQKAQNRVGGVLQEKKGNKKAPPSEGGAFYSKPSDYLGALESLLLLAALCFLL